LTLLITDKDIAALPLSIKAAIPVMEEAFLHLGQGSAENQPRRRTPFRNGFMQFSPGALHAKRYAGFKLWANFGRGSGVHKNKTANGHDYVYDMDSGELLALVHTFMISLYRTSAVTAVAVKYLSPENASTLGMYGAGRIAAGQLEAVCAVRSIKSAKVYTRTLEKCAEFCRKMSDRLNIDVTPARTPEEAAADTGIVITATTSEVPVLLGRWLHGPGLIVAAGANHWYKRELDERVVERADMLIVDDEDQARVECGNLLWSVTKGITTWDRVEAFGDIVAGRIPVPDFVDSNFLFCSHGLSITDVAIAAKTYELAIAAGVGSRLDL